MSSYDKKKAGVRRGPCRRCLHLEWLFVSSGSQLYTSDDQFSQAQSDSEGSVHTNRMLKVTAEPEVLLDQCLRGSQEMGAEAPQSTV